MKSPAEVLRINYEFGYITADQYERALARLPAEHRPEGVAAEQSPPAMQIPAWELPLVNPVAPPGERPKPVSPTPYNDPALDAISRYLTERYEAPVVEAQNIIRTTFK